MQQQQQQQQQEGGGEGGGGGELMYTQVRPANQADNDNDDNDRAERRNLRFLQSLHRAANCLQHVLSSGQGAVVHKSRAAHQALITYNMSCVTPYSSAIKFDRV